MQINIIKRKFLFILPFSFLVMAFFYTACKKNLKPDTNSNPFIESAQNWFTKEVVQKEKEMLALPYSDLPRNDYKRKLARMGKIAELLNWNEAKEYNRNGVQYAIVPINENSKPLSNKNYEASRSFVFLRISQV